MIDHIIRYFYSDPLKILYLLGGSGGIWFWYEKWRSRIVIELEIQRETYLVESNSVEIQFECRNIGYKKTSLKRNIEIVSFTDSRKKLNTLLKIQQESLELPPHENKIFTAKGVVVPSYYFSFLKRYVVKPTVGYQKSVFTIKSRENVSNIFSWNLLWLRARWLKWNPRIIQAIKQQ